MGGVHPVDDTLGGNPEQAGDASEVCAVHVLLDRQSARVQVVAVVLGGRGVSTPTVLALVALAAGTSGGVLVEPGLIFIPCSGG